MGSSQGAKAPEADGISLIHFFAFISNFKLKYSLPKHESHFCAKINTFGRASAGRIMAFHEPRVNITLLTYSLNSQIDRLQLSCCAALIYRPTDVMCFIYTRGFAIYSA